MRSDRTSKAGAVVAVAVAGLLGTTWMMPATGAEGDTTRVSLSSSGSEGDDQSRYPAVSADGRYVAFHSEATNLIPDDTNARSDVFLRDTETGETTLVSVNSDGIQAELESRAPSISADGRYISFESKAGILVPGNTNGEFNVFLHDTVTGETTIVSVDNDGNQGSSASYASSVSNDGRYVVFETPSSLHPDDTNGAIDIYIRDMVAEETSLVSVATDGGASDGTSFRGEISGDGSHVVFDSGATDLVTDDANGLWDVFIRDLTTGETSLVSVASDGTQADSGASERATVSGDGRYVAFDSSATNLVPGDTNGVNDVFVHDTVAETTERVSMSTGGEQGDNPSLQPTLSATGDVVAFMSHATNLVSGDTNGAGDVFAHDISSGDTSRVSVASDGTEGDGSAWQPDISPSGRHIAFYSHATNLVTGDTNGVTDVFVHQYLPDPPPSTTTTTTTMPPLDDAFSDDDDSVFEDDINAIAAAGITRGCNPPDNTRFCPADDVSRGQMAAFLNRALDLAPSATDFFSDDDDSVFEDDINAIAAAGITRGCNPPDNTRFCPADNVSRGQMAAFLNRALLP